MSEQPIAPDPRSDYSRRAFLAAGAAAAAGGAILAAGAAAADGPVAGPPRDKAPKGKPFKRVADGEPIRMGVIGTGGMGSGHCGAFMSLAKAGKENVQIVALADVCQPRLEAARQQCESGQGITVDTYGDYRKLLERDDIHAVLIATPEHWHAKNGADAILAGKDVYLEKPMTLDLPMALYLRSVQQANPEIIVQVGTQMTRLPKYPAARQMVKDGKIGTPVWSQTSYCRNSKEGEWLYYSIDPAWKPGVNLDWDMWCGPLGAAPWDPEVYARWRRYKKYSTGIIGDLLVHVMTPLTLAVDAGWPTRVVASGNHEVDKAMENFDQVNLTITFENGHQMIVAGSTCNEVGLETMIRGHKGNLYLGGRHCEFRPERIFVDDGLEQERIECEDIGNDQDVHRLNFMKCVRTRERPDSDIEQGTKIMVIVDLATRSMWEGGAYRFDPKTMTAWKV
ncbi:MAG: Gfo/Idh/MocA family oxidoreductase [Phycisphaerales bacterium]|nr:Gfo/Idh/MocA family oxidoreductase [Phycisphaerales bacterium]